MGSHPHRARGMGLALAGLALVLLGTGPDRLAVQEAAGTATAAGGQPGASKQASKRATRHKPQQIPESPQIQTKVSAVKDPARRAWDIRPYLAMEDGQQAAAALRASANGWGLRLDATKPERATASSKGGRPATDTSIALFNGQVLPPEDGVEAALMKQAQRLVAQSRGDEKLVAILQVQPDVRLRDILAVLEAGVKVHAPLGHGAAIIQLPAAAVLSLRDERYIRWLGEYKPQYKYDPRSTTRGKSGALLHALGGDRPEYRADLSRLGIQVEGYDSTLGAYDVVLAEGRFGEVAEALWWVRDLVREPQETPAALGYEPDDSRDLILAFDTPYNGLGVAVGVRDEGIWALHPDLAGHLLPGSDTQTNDKHGTAVCSILMGRGTRSLGCPHNARGVAFGADLLFKSTAKSYASAFTAWRNAGVLLSNHSYSFTSGTYAYDASTTAYDTYADLDDAVIVAAGGDNGRFITNPGTGKNVLTVGALTYATSEFDKLGEWADYSNPGPTRDDLRLKPDLVAPGGGDGDNTYGVVGANSTPDGIATGDEWPADDMYVRLSGTSMAAPHVTGVCAKIKQWKPDIHSELLKALLINTTIPIRDNSADALAGYANTLVGYGMVNGYGVTDAYAGESQRVLFVEGTVNEDSRTDEWPITVPAGVQKLVVTLAYNDQPGAWSPSRALQDDLDLSLTSPGGVTEYAHAHKAAGVTGESPLEKMVIEKPASGTWIARVQFTDSPSFGDPFTYGEQRYGLVGHLLFKTPALDIAVSQTSYEVAPGEPFVLEATVTNTGGCIATGVRVTVVRPVGTAPGSLGPEADVARFVGSLPCQDAETSMTFHLTAPTEEGVYFPAVTADGTNLEFAKGYPQLQEVRVNVRKPPVPSPANVAASDGTYSDRVRITWTAVPEYSYYRVYRAASLMGTKVPLTAWQPMSVYDDTTCQPGVTYYYWVQTAANNNGFRASELGRGESGWCGQPTIGGYILKASGNGLAGVVLTGLPGSPVTDENGYYSGAVPPGWSGTATPQRSGYTFTPASRTYSNIQSNIIDQDYDAASVTYTLSGHVRDSGGAGVAGVVLNGLAGPPVTDANGYYTGSVEYDWGGTVAPAQAGYKFTPPRRTYIDVEQDFSEQDYVPWQGLDLRAASARYSVPWPTPVAGQAIALQVTIVNEGTTTAQSYRVDIWKNRSDPPTSAAGSDDHQVLSDLPADDAMNVPFSVVYDQPGTYSLWAMVTPLGGQTDRDLSDNVCHVSVEVRAPRADLVIERVNPAAKYPPGGRQFAVTVTIRNQGASDAGRFRVNLWKHSADEPADPATCDTSIVVNSLARDQGITLAYDVFYPVAGTYSLWIVTDAEDSIAEMDESNNSRQIAMHVGSFQGDADGDGRIDVGDLMAVTNALSSGPGDAAWNASCDFNTDGRVDLTDLQVVLNGYGANALAGIWNGTAQYTVSTLTNGVAGVTGSFSHPTTLTFDATGRPYALDLCLGEDQKVWSLSTENLASAGDVAVFRFVCPDPISGAVTIKTLSAEVSRVTYGTRSYFVELQLTITSSGASTGIVTAVYSRTASLQANGTILWTGNTALLLDGGQQMLLASGAQGILACR